MLWTLDFCIYYACDSLLLTQSLQFCNKRQKCISHITMMCQWMMLHKVICQIHLTGGPINFKLTLLFPIQQPFKPHIHRFSSSLRSNSQVYYSFRRRIISLDWRAWLGMSISCKIRRMCTASFVLMNNAPNSASAVDDITASIICAIVNIAPLFGGF
jgi:hypothetical protein